MYFLFFIILICLFYLEIILFAIFIFKNLIILNFYV